MLTLSRRTRHTLASLLAALAIGATARLVREPIVPVARPALIAPATVIVGAALEVRASHATSITAHFAGAGQRRLQVIDGLARCELPTTVAAGDVITISDERYPDPAVTTVLVVAAGAR